MNVTIMQQIADDLKLEAFDLMLLADGSGTSATTPCGWTCYAYTPVLVTVSEYSGGLTQGSNNFAELTPFVLAMWGEYNRRVKDGGDLSFPLAVELVSDSELTVRCGNRMYSRNANLPLWGALNWFESQAYSFHWNHVPRNSNPANTMADQRGRDIRQWLEKFDRGK